MSDTHRRHVLWTLNIATENGEYRWESTVYREHQQGERCTSDMMHCEHQAICTVHITPYEPYTVNIEQVNHEHQHDERCTSTTEHCEHQQYDRYVQRERKKFKSHCRLPHLSSAQHVPDIFHDVSSVISTSDSFVITFYDDKSTTLYFWDWWSAPSVMNDGQSNVPHRLLTSRTGWRHIQSRKRA